MGTQVKLALDQNLLNTHAYEFSIQHAATKFTNDYIALALAPFTRYKNLHCSTSFPHEDDNQSQAGAGAIGAAGRP